MECYDLMQLPLGQEYVEEFYEKNKKYPAFFPTRLVYKGKDCHRVWASTGLADKLTKVKESVLSAQTWS